LGLSRRFLERRIPVYVDGGLNVVDVRDVADGHLLAEAKGKTGERYILGGRNFTLQRLFSDLQRISGVPAPSVRLNPELAAGGAILAERLGLPLSIAVDETRSAAQWWTYSSAKAKRELGFTSRPHEETLEDAVAGVSEALGGRVGREPTRAESAMEAAGRLANLAARLSPL
jgi:dihydroflavonol-4-reductase